MDKTDLECLECGHKFSRKLGPNTFEVRCPKCHGYDTDLADVPGAAAMRAAFDDVEGAAEARQWGHAQW